MYVGHQYQNQIFYDYLGNIKESVIIDEKGYGVFPVKMEVSVFIYPKKKW